MGYGGPPQGFTGPSPQALRGFEEQDVVALTEMFPELGRDVVESVLLTNGGNKEASVNALLNHGLSWPFQVVEYFEALTLLAGAMAVLRGGRPWRLVGMTHIPENPGAVSWPG